MEERNPARDAAGTHPSEVVCGQASRTWRRQLGAVAWAALEELALTARHDEQGWASPVGVRAIATGIGTTDVAALRAVAALGTAGLVVLEPVTNLNGQRRFGCRLHLPDGIELRHCPHQNGQPAEDARSPTTYVHRHTSQDDRRCPTHQDTAPVGEETGGNHENESGRPTEPPRHHQSSGRHTKEHR
jgi:hypothetical protein